MFKGPTRIVDRDFTFRIARFVRKSAKFRSECALYTVIHKIGTICIFAITFSIVDRFE